MNFYRHGAEGECGGHNRREAPRFCSIVDAHCDDERIGVGIQRVDSDAGVVADGSANLIPERLPGRAQCFGAANADGQQENQQAGGPFRVIRLELLCSFGSDLWRRRCDSDKGDLKFRRIGAGLKQFGV
jgi:hypothetical protein